MYIYIYIYKYYLFAVSTPRSVSSLACSRVVRAKRYVE